MDGLSSASAVFAVASIAIQLGDGVKKLLKLYSAIRGAPAKVDALFKDLALLSLILDQAHTIDYGSKSNGITELALESCITKIKQLRDKVEKSAAHLGSSSKIQKKWSALNITLKEHEIVDLRTSIYQALAVLDSAQINSLA
jgi:hypothetical protein